MSPNPYQPPSPYEPPYDPRGGMRPVNRTPFVLAAVGAGLASAYWAFLTLWIGLSVAVGSMSPFQVLLPCVLIGLYAWRGIQIFKGDPAAAKRVMWLHGVGGVMALVQISSGILVVPQGIKLLIHVFGAVTAYLAQRAFTESQSGRM